MAMTTSTYSYSTQSSVKILQLQDHVPVYFFTTFINELLSYFKHLFFFLFLLGAHESVAIETLKQLVGAQCLTKLSGCIASAAFELISPRIGTSFSSAGKIVYNYAVALYFLLSIVFYVIFGLLRPRGLLTFYTIAPISYAFEAFQQAVGRVERWNGAHIVSCVLCPCTQIAVLAVFLLCKASLSVSVYFAFVTPTFVFGLILLFQKKYLRVKLALFKPFRWHLALQLIINAASFILFDALEDILVYVGLQTQTDDTATLALILYYLSMRISCAAVQQLYYYVVQAQRLFLITRQGSSGIKTRTLFYFVFAIAWGLIVFVAWAPTVKLLIGQRIPVVIGLNQKSKLLDYSRFGALRGVAETLYAYEIAYARAHRDRMFVYFNETIRILSVAILFIIAQLTRGNSNYCSIYNVQTIVELMLGLAGIAKPAAFRKQKDKQPEKPATADEAFENQMEQQEVVFDSTVAKESHLPNSFTFGELKKDTSSAHDAANNSQNTARGFQLLEANMNISANSTQLEFGVQDK